MNELLEPGFAGLLSLEEAEHIQQKLERSSRLKRIWGIRGKITLPKIAAMAYPEDAAEAKAFIRREMGRGKRQNRLRERNSSKTIAGKM